MPQKTIQDIDLSLTPEEYNLLLKALFSAKFNKAESDAAFNLILKFKHNV